jgi:hypothetical protein
MENSSDTIGNRTRDLLAFSAVSQPTAPPRTLFINPSNPSGHYVYHQFNIQQHYVLPTQRICVFCASQNKQRLFAHTTLTDWFSRRVRKIPKSDLASLCLSVRPHGTTRFPLDGFSWTFIFDYFSIVCLKKFKFH